MSKKIVKVVKMELPGGEAHPGPKLASAGVVMNKFCTDFNAKTGDRRGETVPVIITAYEDKSYDFVIKTSPVAERILKAAGIKKGSSNAKTIVGHISQAQLEEMKRYCQVLASTAKYQEGLNQGMKKSFGESLKAAKSEATGLREALAGAGSLIRGGSPAAAAPKGSGVTEGEGKSLNARGISGSDIA